MSRESRRTKENTGEVTILGMNSPLERVGNDPECQVTGKNMELMEYEGTFIIEDKCQTNATNTG